MNFGLSGPCSEKLKECWDHLTCSLSYSWPTGQALGRYPLPTTGIPLRVMKSRRPCCLSAEEYVSFGRADLYNLKTVADLGLVCLVLRRRFLYV